MPRDVNRNGHRFRVYDGSTSPIPNSIGYPSYIECDIDDVPYVIENLMNSYQPIRNDCIYDAYGNVAIEIDRDDTSHEELYPPDMSGMTLDEFQAWSDQIIREATE